ncbi:MAG: hypothetical protein WBE86_00765 [Candidatus Acidiferrales bacterium]
MDNPTNLPDAISGILNSEPAKNLLSPVSKEVGEFLGSVASLARFYITNNLETIFKISASVIDKDGNSVGNLQTICESAVSAWQGELRKAGVPL